MNVLEIMDVIICAIILMVHSIVIVIQATFYTQMELFAEVIKLTIRRNYWGKPEQASLLSVGHGSYVHRTCKNLLKNQKAPLF